MTPSKILFYFCISFIAGIFLESVIKIPQILLWVFLFIDFLVIIVCLLIKKNNLVIISFCLLFLVIGVVRMEISEFNIVNDKLSKFNGKGQVVFFGIISDESDIRDASQKIKVKVGDSTLLVTTNRYPEYKYLDKVRLAGKLESPSETEDFSYKNYLMKDRIYSVMNFPKIETLPQKQKYSLPSFLYEKVLFLKQKIRESIQYNFSPPQSLILEGTVLGDNGAMTNDLKNKLNITGLRHVIAVSGTHVVILSSIIMVLLMAVGFCRGRAFYIAIIFICFYIILTGLPASGIRAGIMGGLYLLAQKLGRQNMGMRVVVLAGTIMLLFNPLLLVYDVGFQLSFLAVIGLIYIEPILTAAIKFFTKGNLENLVKIVSATFAAQIFTLPIMIYSFGNISFISPITNLLILPIVSWLMGLGFLVSVVGIFSNILGQILSIPCWLVLTYFVKVIDVFSKPWAIKTFENVHWIWLAFLYFIIISVTWFLNKKYSQKFV